MSNRLRFEVIGHPEPAGSKRAFRTKTGKTVVTDANPQSLGWKTEVAQAAAQAMTRADHGALFDGPLGLAVVFTLVRPKGHFGSGRNGGQVKPGAPPFPVVRPDCTKLLRATEDALTGVVWRDDAQVVEQMVTKRYGEPERVQVSVWSL
jgi:Holliday junction resolvase RusA-like endonuclease